MGSLNQFQWNEVNRRRNYPFTDGTTLQVQNAFLPKEWAVDAILTPPQASEDVSSYFISRIHKEESNITITLSTQAGEVGYAALAPHSKNTHVKFYGKVSKRYIGSLIVNPVYNGSLWSFDEGSTRVPPKTATFVASVIHPVPSSAVTGIRAAAEGSALTGAAYLVGGEGVTLSQTDADSMGNATTIRVDIDGDPNYARHDCEADQASYMPDGLKAIIPCIMRDDGTIDVGPSLEADEQGNFVILPSNTHDTDSAAEPTDIYNGTKPSLRIYPKSGVIYFEVAGLGKGT